MKKVLIVLVLMVSSTVFAKNNRYHQNFRVTNGHSYNTAYDLQIKAYKDSDGDERLSDDDDLYASSSTISEMDSGNERNIEVFDNKKIYNDNFILHYKVTYRGNSYCIFSMKYYVNKKGDGITKRENIGIESYQNGGCGGLGLPWIWNNGTIPFKIYPTTN